ncbi:MAG: ECF-family polymerase sigma factor [Myxococcaceae bacterium]|nr:ECF-family polymerase sigma factor [Myxococcaceae bacterium]
MTGSSADADDLVQDTFERALSRPPSDLQTDPLPWLVRVALNLSRDQLRRRKRQAYVGPWLPAPIETEGYSFERAPDVRYSELESVSMAFLVALEALTPLQRAVLVLIDVLGYSVREAALALDKSESNVKTSHHRARAALARYDATRVPLDQARVAQVQLALSKLMLSLQAGDVVALEEQLSADVRALNDSNGEFFAAQVPVIGRARVIKFHLKLRRTELPRFALRILNGLPAIVGEYESAGERIAKRLVFFIALDAEGLISEVNSTVATRKLAHVPFTF